MNALSDEDLLGAAEDAAHAADAGHPPSNGVISLIRAVAMTREQAHRNRLEREARARNPNLGDVGLALLRVLLVASL